MDPTQEIVVQVVENWAGTRVHKPDAVLVEIYREGGNTVWIETAIETLIQAIVATFPQRRIQIARSDLLGKSPPICTVADLVTAVGLSGNEDTDFKRRPPTNP